MPYKGGDLNLRLASPPLAREAAPATPSRGLDATWRRPDTPGGHALAVDEQVLASCNCAYDVARFHGSREVGLEHLLHALTRVPAAAQTLAGLGIGANVLRRETAVAIAAEPPAAIAEEGEPRASVALEDALRRAADHAERPLQPVTMHDLVRALLGGGPESPAAALLMRAAADPQRLARWRDEPRREALAGAAPVGSNEPETRSLLPAGGEALLGRLERVEASLQALRQEAAADRRSFADLARAIEAELQALRQEGAQARSVDRSEAVDAVLEAKLGEFGEAMAALAGRLGAVDKLATGDNWQALETRLVALQDRVAAQTSELANTLPGMLSPHLRPLEESVERQVAIEAVVRAGQHAAQEASEARDRQLGEIQEAMVMLGIKEQTLAENLATWRIETGGDLGILSSRLQQLEDKTLNSLDRLNGEVQALRQDCLEEGARRGNGFKRWLYGTGSVFAASWREEAASIRQTLGRSSTKKPS